MQWTSRGTARALASFGTAGLALALYANSLPGDFVFDDHSAIQINPDVRWGRNHDKSPVQSASGRLQNIADRPYYIDPLYMHSPLIFSPLYRTNTPLSSVFRNDFWGLPLSDAESHKSYRPLTVLSFRLNHNLHGLWAPGFHAVNVVLHVAVCVLFFWACLGLGASLATSLSAGLLFVSHPIHTEAVSGPESPITHSHLPDSHVKQLKLHTVPFTETL